MTGESTRGDGGGARGPVLSPCPHPSAPRQGLACPGSSPGSSAPSPHTHTHPHPHHPRPTSPLQLPRRLHLPVAELLARGQGLGRQWARALQGQLTGVLCESSGSPEPESWGPPWLASLHSIACSSQTAGQFPCPGRRRQPPRCSAHLSSLQLYSSHRHTRPSEAQGRDSPSTQTPPGAPRCPGPRGLRPGCSRRLPPALPQQRACPPEKAPCHLSMPLPLPGSLPSLLQVLRIRSCPKIPSLSPG